MDALSPPDLSAIVANATFLNELMVGASSRPERRSAWTKAKERSRRWRENLAIEDGVAIPGYLTENCSEDHVLSILTGDACAAHEPLPAWAEILGEVITAGRLYACDISHDDALMLAEYPFGELLNPFLIVARRHLQARLSAEISALLAPAAFLDIDRAFLAELSERLGDSFLDAFSKVRSEGSVLIDYFLGRASAVGGDDHYRRFVASLESDGLRRFFELYPVAARLAAVKLCDMLDFVCELLTRLDADFHELWPEKNRCAGSAIARLTFGLSDPHGGSRSVVVVTTQGDERIVYKPRSLAAEQAWNALLVVLDPDLRRPRVVARDDYGWMEFVAPAHCTAAGQVELFFRRLGKLLCASFVFGGKDFHRDNLIAAGDQPVLVDLETLGQPDPRSIAMPADPIERARQARNELLWSSVLRAEFLPRRRRSSNGVAYDESALSSPADHQAATMEWRGLGTDTINRSRTVRPSPGANLPSLNGVPVRAEDYAAAILSGFTDAWNELANIGPRLVAAGGALAAMRDLPFRFIFRGTDIYYAILQQAGAARNLASGIDFSIELQGLYRAVADCIDPALCEIVNAEIEALQRGDIPRFGGSTSSDTLDDGVRRPLAGYFATSGIRAIERRLAQLTPSNLKTQLRIITAVLASEQGRRSASSFPSAASIAASASNGVFGCEEALTAARAIGDELLAAAMSLPDRSFCWSGLTYCEEAAGFQIEAMNNGLYEGNAGVALFLAALHRASHDERYQVGARRALSGVSALAHNASIDRRKGARELGLGAGGGIGGFIYALVRIGRLLDDDAFIKDAKALSLWLGDDVLAEQTEWDVLNGSAGALAGLLMLADAAGDRDALTLARACGRHVLACIQQTDPSSRKGAFAHGSAGAAALLVRLARRTEDETLLHTALTLLRDDVSDASPASAVGGHEATGHLGWCGGAAGLGFARLTGIPDVDGSQDPVIAATIDAIRCSGGAVTDQICCGNFGTIDFLLSAGRILDRPDFEREAWRRAGAVVDRAKHEGGFRLLPGVPPSYAGPGLFQGLAGIGYELLRLAAPERFPSILMME